MASIRRTLSPVPRAGALQNGEVHSTPSPLSRTSYGQTSTQSGGLFSKVIISMDSHPFLYRIHSAVLCMFSQRPSHSLERSKSKGSLWRRAFMHFFIFFMVGIFVGFTPFLSMTSSISFESQRQAFSFDVVPPASNTNGYDGTSTNTSSKVGNSMLRNNSELEMEGKMMELINMVPEDNSVTESTEQEIVLALRKLLIIVTPTYARPYQAYYLHRLAQTLKLVRPPLLWIVVEMSSQSVETADLLRRTGIMYRHLVCNKNLTDIRDGRVHQRNVALTHIETHRLDGIVHFADDNNMYSADLFEHMQDVRRFGIWPIAILTESKNKVILEGPVCNGSQVSGWHANFRTGRIQRFHTDLSGFAFNSTILWDPKRWHRPTPEPIRQLDAVKEGVQDGVFVEQLVEDESQMEGLLNCSRILVWDLHLEASHPFYPPKWTLEKDLDVVNCLCNIVTVAKVHMDNKMRQSPSPVL